LKYLLNLPPNGVNDEPLKPMDVVFEVAVDHIHTYTHSVLNVINTSNMACVRNFEVTFDNL